MITYIELQVVLITLAYYFKNLNMMFQTCFMLLKNYIANILASGDRCSMHSLIRSILAASRLGGQAKDTSP
jgi:hypothetical protein